MAQAQRQSNLFAAEDWRTIYRTFSEINFTAYDFDTIKSAMVEYMQNNFPEDFNDYIESSEFIAIVELLAYMGQTIAFRQDLNVRENFLDTAERKESVLRLAEMLNYKPKRNIPSTGLIKVYALRTTESVLDSTGQELANRNIIWNDANNTEYLEQFILILNRALLSRNPYGTPVKKGTLNGIITELYQLNSRPNTNVVYNVSSTVNSVSAPFEVVNATFEDEQYVTEIEPNPTSSFGLLYLNDGLGNSSESTGFFTYIKQGSLEFKDFNIAVPLANRAINVPVTNINEFDVWVQTIDSTGEVLASWTKVPSVSGTNVIYNSVIQGTRNIFSVETQADDTINIRFADGNFGDIPYGIIRVWYRTSLNQQITVRPEDVQVQSIRIPYTDTEGLPQTLTVTLELLTSMANSLPAETVTEIKTNAAQTYYTQDRMITGEDYNIYPIFKNPNILKLKSVNRTHSGHNRGVDINDPTGTIQNLNVFAEDGMLYRDLQDTQVTFNLTASMTANTIIQRYIQTQLSVDELTNFYYDTYRKEVQRLEGAIAWKLTNTEQLQWVCLPNSKESNTGYFVEKDKSFLTTNSVTIGSSLSTGKRRYLTEQSLIEFTNQAGNDIQYATIENIISNGDPAGLTTGPVELNKEIPQGFILTRFFPTLRRLFNQTEKVAITAQLDLKNTFGIGYDYTTLEYYVIAPNNLDNVTLTYNRTFARDVTGDNKDASWIIKVEYFPATSSTSASYTITTRGLRYIFESEQDVRFYFNNEYKTIDINTGFAKKDLLSLLKVNVDRRAQIESVTITNPGSGYSFAPSVTFSAAGEVDEAQATAYLSWNTVTGGIGGSGYLPTDTSLTYLDSTVVDGNGNQTEISINNEGVLAPWGRSLQLKANLSSNASATILMANDAVGSITLTNGGANYTSPPTVTISAPAGVGGVQATASAIIAQELTGWNFTATNYQGGGYQNVPNVYIDPPGYTGSTWTVNHNLNQKYVNFEIVDENHRVINTVYNPPTVTFVDANTLTVNWGGVVTPGYINIIKSRYGFGTLIPSSNIWEITHNLTGTDGIVNIDIINAFDDESMQAKTEFPLIEYTTESTCRVIFPSGVALSGYVVAHNSAGNAGATGSGYVHEQLSPATTWTISHNLGMKHCSVDIAVLGTHVDGADFSESIDPTLYYNIRGSYSYPTITFVDENTLTVTFATATPGKAVITYGDYHGSQQQSVGIAHMEVGDDATNPSGCPPVTINSGGSGFVAGDVGKIYTVVGGTGTSATVTIATVDTVGGTCTGVTLTDRGDYTALPTVIGCATSGEAGSVGVGLTLDLNFRVKTVELTVSGDGYQSTPNVIIDPPIGTCGTGTQAEGEPTLDGEVASINVDDPGSGYTGAPVITISGGGGVGATATATLSNSVVGATILSSGSGYRPTGEILTVGTFGAADASRASGIYGGVSGTSTGAGLNALFTITVDASGAVTAVTIPSGGFGYEVGDIITISDAVLGAGGAPDFTMLVASVYELSVTFPAPSSPGAITPVTATGTAVVNASGNVTGISITQGGTGYSSPADDSQAITIPPSGVIESIEITDTGYGYTSPPFITYPTTAGGTGASQAGVFGFVSRVQMNDFGSGYTINDAVTFTTPPAPGTQAQGTLLVQTTKPYTDNINFNMSSLLTYEDGYRDPKKVLVTFADSDNDLIPDDPLSFDKFVTGNKHIFQETYVDFDGYVYYRLTRNVLEAASQADEDLILADGATFAGKYIYRTDTTQFKKISVSAPYTATVLVNDTDGTTKFKAYIGRSTHITPTVTSTEVIEHQPDDVFFQWKHYAPVDQRVDPSATNLVDLFVLTRTYYTEVLSWKANNRSVDVFPAPPTTAELGVSMDLLSTYKSISDEIVYKPVKFKLLFGSAAGTELQAKFKVIKVVGSTMSDNELQSSVIEKVNEFFDITNWDLGESFYYTELSAYIHQNLPSHLSSIVIVPKQAESNFGNLFQVKAEPDELFLSVATVADVEVVKGFTEQNLKIR